METARQLQTEGHLSEAASAYQKLFNSDPYDLEVIGRLLTIYRKLKDFQKELSVLDQAIAAYQRKQKAAQDNWIRLHPKAANVSRSMLKQLRKGGNSEAGLGTDKNVERWMKRKELVMARITGKKVKRKKDQTPGSPKLEKPVSKKIQASDKLKEQKTESDHHLVDRKVPKIEHSITLFVVILRNLVFVEKLDALMKRHKSYLNKHILNGNFIVSGHQVPETGEIILARGKTRSSMEKTLQQDPLAKHKMVSIEIIEFEASHLNEYLEKLLKKK